MVPVKQEVEIFLAGLRDMGKTTLSPTEFAFSDHLAEKLVSLVRRINSWIPSFFLNGRRDNNFNGFGGDYGGLGIRYNFRR